MPTTIKQALKKWEETTGKKAYEATEVKLIGVYPPIEKVWLEIIWCNVRSAQVTDQFFYQMDSALNSLSSCEKLSLSTNMITNIQNLQNLKCLKILSLGRNLIKNVAGKFIFWIQKNER